MQFTVNVQDLLDGLNTVTRALALRAAKQILEGVMIEAFEDEIKISCTDGSLCISSVIQARIKEEGRAVLPGRLFTDLVRKLPAGEASIKVNERYSAQVNCNQSRFTLSGMNPEEYPDLPQVTGSVSLKLQQNILRDMISRVVFAIAVDESRQILTGCLLEAHSDRLLLVALDGYRMAIQRKFQPVEMPAGTECFKAIIPGKVMAELGKLLPEEDTFCTLSFDRNRMRVEFGNSTLYSVLLAGEYIDYNKILPTAFQTEVLVDKDQLQSALDRASLMAREGKNNLVRMSLSDEKMTITSNAELGDVYEEMNCILKGDSLNIAFNAKYINDVIRNIGQDELCMKFNSSISPCVFTPKEGDDFLYLILPVRVFQ